MARPAQVEEKKVTLLAWLEDQGRDVVGAWYLDRYDPPWTLWYARTNELVVRVR